MQQSNTNNNSLLGPSSNNIINNRSPNYPSLQNIEEVQNDPQVIQINRHNDIMFYLRQIADNTSEQRRRNQDSDMVNCIIIFFVLLFFIYMGIHLYRATGFCTITGIPFYCMILTLFLLIVLLHRQDVESIKNIKCK